MKLSSLLDKNLIFSNVKGRSKDEAIQDLINKIATKEVDLFKQKNHILDSVLSREHEVPTALGKGMMIPHARVKDFEDVIVAIGIPETPFKCQTAFNTEDEIKIIFLIIAPQMKNQLMLKLMSGITKLGIDDNLIQQIVMENNSESVIKIIEESDIQISEKVTAEDIMNPDIIPAHLDDTIEDIAKRFTMENIHGLPVLDDNSQFIGEITERELIKYGMPEFTSFVRDLSFLTIGEPFEKYFEDESSITVKELYRQDTTVIDRKMSIMEISFIMVNKGKTRLYIVEDGEYFGMINRGDIIRKVLHI